MKFKKGDMVLFKFDGEYCYGKIIRCFKEGSISQKNEYTINWISGFRPCRTKAFGGYKKTTELEEDLQKIKGKIFRLL